MAAATTTVRFREWIRGALNYIDSNDGSLGGSSLSWNYVNALIWIALSLADQVANAEDLAQIGIAEGLNLLPRATNGAVLHWAEFVTVRSNNNRDAVDNEQDPLGIGSSIPTEPLAYNATPRFNSMSAKGGELEAFLDDFVEDFDRRLAESNTARSEISDVKLPHIDQGYLNVHSAEIVATGNSDDGDVNIRSESNRVRRERLYFLGQVFYELFSGGELPPPELFARPSAWPSLKLDLNEQPTKQSDDALADFDFARDMRAFDDINAEKEEEFFNDLISDDSLGLLERLQDPSASSNSSRSRKKQSTVYQTHKISDGGEGDDGVALCKVSAQVSIEQLKLNGIPSSLCDLIFNMIDSINMEFSGDEAYTNMIHVAEDLRLMLRSPEKYLKELDMEALTFTGLEINETVFVRDEEYASLQNAYNRAVSGSSEMALISGDAGTGKTWLAERLGRFIVSNGGIFLEGKFDRLRQTQPFSVLATVFNKFCDILIQEADKDHAKLVASKLQEALGLDACHLIKVIPNLGELIFWKDSDADQSCVDPQERIMYLMRRFVETVTSCSNEILTLYFDDLQWAPDTAISAIGQILKSPEASKRVFFLGCFRRDEVGNKHPFTKMMGALDTHTTTIELSCVNKEVINKMTASILRLSPRLVRSLSDILYKKTKGNPLFYSNLILSLSRDGVLYLSLRRGRWEWDEEALHSRRLPDDVAVFFTNCIGNLRSDVQSALFTASCFGASTEVDFIKELEAHLGVCLMDPLKVAEEEGFVRICNAQCQFLHDCIQESTYGMISAEKRCLYHLQYGMCLAEISLKTNNDNMLFAGVEQLNMGGPSSVTNDEQRFKIAQFNVIAGKKSMDQSDFRSGLIFFDNGISFLKGRTHWKEHYRFSLELFELAATCAQITGDMITLTILSDQVTQNAQCFNDTLNMSYTCMSALGYASKISCTVEMGLSILSKLGEDLPRELSDIEVNIKAESTKSMLDELSVVDLLNYRVMTDNKKLMAMKFLRRLENVIQQVQPNLQPAITIKMVEVTIGYGLSPMSPIAFAYFGSLIARLGDIRGGFKYSTLAKSMVDKMHLKEITGEVIFVHTEVACFIEPICAANVYRLDGEAITLAVGDVNMACYLRTIYAAGVFWSGPKLSLTADLYSQSQQILKSRGHVITEIYATIVYRTVSVLRGTEGDGLSYDELKQLVMSTKTPLCVSLYYFQQTYLSFILNDYESIKAHAKEYFNGAVSSQGWTLMSINIYHVFYCGLVSFRLHRETKDDLWLERGRKFNATMKSWNEQGCLWTFENKMHLMEAEFNFCTKNFDNARTSYDMSISSAKTHKAVSEEAMAYELGASFCFSIGDFSTSLEYYTIAHAKYQEWGAVHKVNLLYEFIQQKFTTFPFVTPTTAPNQLAQTSLAEEADPRKRRQP